MATLEMADWQKAPFLLRFALDENFRVTKKSRAARADLNRLRSDRIVVVLSAGSFPF
jgi:hypothetical protein